MLKLVEFLAKNWGQTASVVSHPTFALHHIKVLPGGYCSRHIHRHRANGFYLLSGSLTVRMPDGDKLLKAGQYLLVPAGVEHQFATGEGCEALEVYFPQLPDEEDIVRYSLGGVEQL